MQTKKTWPLVLGIDYSNQSLKYLLINRGVRGIKIEGFGKYLINGDNVAEEVESILSWLFKNNKLLSKAQIVIGVEDNDIVLKTEKFPNLSRKEIAQSVEFAIQREIAQEGAEAIVISDFYSIANSSASSDQADYIIMGAPEDVIDRKAGPIVAAGLTPAKVIPTVSALMNLIQFIPEFNSMGVTGFLDIGAKRSMLAFINNGKVDFFREILVGGDDFTKGITGTIFHEGRAIQLLSDEADEFKMKYGYPLGFSEGMSFRGAPVAEVGTMMRPVVERFIGEIKRSIGFYKDKSEGEDVETLYLFGGGAQLKNLPEILSEKIDISVLPFPVPKDISVSGDKKYYNAFQNKFLEQAVSFSLALESSPEGNLLPEVFKKIHRSFLVQRYIFLSFFLFIFVLIGIWWSRNSDIRKFNTRIAGYERRISSIRNANNNAQRLTILKEERGKLQKQIDFLKINYGQDENLIQTLKFFSNITPKIFMINFYEYMDYTEYKNRKTRNRAAKKIDEDENIEKNKNKIIFVQVICDDPPKDVEMTAFKFLVDLEDSGYFSEVNVLEKEFAKETGRFLFNLEAVLIGN